MQEVVHSRSFNHKLSIKFQHMLAENRTKAILGISVGILLQVATGWFRNGDHTTTIFDMVLLDLSMVFSAWGCGNWAEGKGHSKWIGLLGIWPLSGLLVLMLLPDHHKAPNDSPA